MIARPTWQSSCKALESEILASRIFNLCAIAACFNAHRVTLHICDTTHVENLSTSMKGAQCLRSTSVCSSVGLSDQRCRLRRRIMQCRRVARNNNHFKCFYLSTSKECADREWRQTIWIYLMTQFNLQFAIIPIYCKSVCDPQNTLSVWAEQS